jgi:hypothetical protein
MDKQNDIDVSHCDYYGYDKECSAEYSLSCGEIEEFERCENLPNCYYRQLQRRIKECEEYKNCLKKVKARVVQENADELLEWIVETIESVDV